ncbi:peptidase C15, pyroglutamyl peptidase I-like protein [Ramaria rubella]|nr:peptidase C15, pyroglutamyl peptidase I-like protein [Ramaria rubella]
MAPTTTDHSKASFHVLVTGYGPFSRVPDNPSWRAVKPLHNALIHTDSAIIHVTTVGPIKVTYPAVLSLIPGLHARPPRLPAPDCLDAPILEPIITPPPEGYDFVFHLGAGRNGALSLEQLGHKLGYRNPGVDGKKAPVIAMEAPVRGFAEGYERFPEELQTEVDVQGVMEHLKQQGETRVVSSTDAGHYLCDFICYGSLAESQRPLFYPPPEGENKETKRSKSLFMHVPYDEHQPHSFEEKMTEAVRQIIAWVCTSGKALPVSSK